MKARQRSNHQGSGQRTKPPDRKKPTICGDITIKNSHRPSWDGFKQYVWSSVVTYNLLASHPT